MSVKIPSVSDKARERGYYFVVVAGRNKRAYWTVGLDTGVGQFPWRLVGDDRQLATSDLVAIGDRITIPLGLAERARVVQQQLEEAVIEVPVLVAPPGSLSLIQQEGASHGR